MSEPLVEAAPAEGDAKRVSSLSETLRGQGVRVIRVSHCDLHGKCRSKELPLAELGRATEGLGYCFISLLEDLNGNPLELPGFAGDSPFPDFQAVADLSTARIMPWEPDTAWLVADLRSDRGLSPRSALERTCARLAATGLSAVAAPEIEFYLVRRGPDGAVARHGSGAGFAYVSGRRADPDGSFGRIQRALHQLGIGVTAAHHEFSPGQFEMNLHQGPAGEAADRAFLLKEALRELAAGEGLQANFMGKPFDDGEGSSLHLHVSLLRDDRNVFAGAEGSAGIGELGRRFVAGVLDHAAAITAIASPTVNSYARLVPGGLVPICADWGSDNRFGYIRIPPEDGSGARVEIRAGDASANPYLVSAVVLAAGLDGIERRLTPPAARAGDSTPSDGTPLPRNLGQALDALEADTTIVDALGPELARTFVALKRHEVERQRRAVTDWDWNEYSLHA